MTSDRPPWALPSGLPPAHLVRASLRAGSLIDAYGSPVPAARSGYLLYPSDALYPPKDLRLGEQLLLDCGLLLEKDGYLQHTEELDAFLALDEDEATSIVFERAVFAVSRDTFDLEIEGGLSAEAGSLIEELIPNPDRREALLLALGRKHDQVMQARLGLRGEEFVVARAKEELIELGRSDLAAGVRRLSEFSDDLGYDVLAPRLNGKRRLEVKTSGRADTGLFRFFVSRNEIDWGLRDADWALVACRIHSDEEIRFVGWCRARALEPYLPVDGEGGRWTLAELEVSATLFEPGLPSAV
jgi:hypothetical protein